jgi:uncharacterized protein YjaZ
MAHIRAGIELSVFEQYVDLINDELEMARQRGKIILLLYVGMFRNNPFAAPREDGSIMVGVPVEDFDSMGDISIVHEFVHAAHHALSGSLGGEEGASLGATILGEGLAMHATRLILPGRSNASYAHSSEAWFRQCNEKLRSILSSIQPILDSREAEVVSNYSVGDGATGLEREVYCVGWHLVDSLLENGYTVPDLVRIEDVAPLVSSQVEAMMHAAANR